MATEITVRYLGLFFKYLATIKYCLNLKSETLTVEWGELGRWGELGQNFSASSPLLLLVKGHWCAMGQKFSAL